MRKHVNEAVNLPDKAALYASVGLTADSAQAPDAGVSTADYFSLLETIAKSEWPSLGFHMRVCAGMRCEEFGAVGLAIKSAPTLRHGFQRMHRYARLYNKTSAFAVEDKGHVYCWTHRRPEPQRLGNHLSNEAALATFLLVYFGVRIFGSTLSQRAQAHPHLGGVDRVFGIFVGLTRALVLLGAIHLVVVAAMPGERTPRWLGEASLYSVSAGAARAIQFVLPGIGRGADALAPVVDSSVRQGFSGDDALPKTQTGPNSPDTAR